MNALEIIEKSFTTEGFDVDRGEALARVLEDIENGSDLVFDYGSVIFTVGMDPEAPLVHLYVSGPSLRIFPACRQFMRDVWNRTGHSCLLAAILNEDVAKLPLLFGWEPSAVLPTGHRMYVARRPQ